MLYIAGLELSESNEIGVKNEFIWLEKNWLYSILSQQSQTKRKNKQTDK